MPPVLRRHLLLFVLTFLMVLQGPALLAGMVAALPQPRQKRVRRVAADCAKAVTGYMTGNLVISRNRPAPLSQPRPPEPGERPAPDLTTTAHR